MLVSSDAPAVRGVQVTYPQALAVAELAFPVIAFYADLIALPSADGLPGHTAADDLKDVLVHGATHLLNSHNPTTNSLVAYVGTPAGLEASPFAEWLQPSARQAATAQFLDPAGKQGVETYAAATAAFAALSVALRTWEKELQLTGPLQQRAAQTFKAMQARAPLALFCSNTASHMLYVSLPVLAA